MCWTNAVDEQWHTRSDYTHAQTQTHIGWSDQQSLLTFRLTSLGVDWISHHYIIISHSLDALYHRWREKVNNSVYYLLRILFRLRLVSNRMWLTQIGIKHLFSLLYLANFMFCLQTQHQFKAEILSGDYSSEFIGFNITNKAQ